MVRQAQLWLLGVSALAVLGVLGCRRSAALPPLVSIPKPFQPAAPEAIVPPVAVIPSRPQASATVFGKSQNPWKPAVSERKWKYIVLHHTASQRGDVESIHDEHLSRKDKDGNPWMGIGYHFVIGNGDPMADGQIEPTFRWKTQIQGAHAGSKDPAYNQVGIGIVLVGNFEKQPPTPLQKSAVTTLVASLKKSYGISTQNVVGHRDLKPTECPGKHFPMAEVASSELSPQYGRLDAETAVGLAQQLRNDLQ